MCVCVCSSMCMCEYDNARIIYIGTFGKELTAAIVGDKNAPAVVLKCIEAVETRGLQSEGIYRVSPSHIQRKNLKEALDKGTKILNCNIYNVFLL